MDIICEAEKLGDFIVNVIDNVEDIMRRQRRNAGNETRSELNPEKIN